MSTSKKGKQGEKLAANFLISHGYEILRENYRHKRGEIDLIAKKNDLLVFVEVKSKARDRYGFPEEAVNSKKEEMIITTADQYLFEEDWQGSIRFDIISILGEGDDIRIAHFEDAFY
jgi:putative endonuclease